MATKAFTLIELLVTIAIVAVVSASVLVAINPTDKIASANDSRALADFGQIATAMNTYATNNGGSYNGTGAVISTWAGLGTMLASEISIFPSTAPPTTTRVAYAVNIPNPATTGVIYTSLLSLKYTAKCTGATPVAFLYWSVTSGGLCGYCNVAATVPTAAIGSCAGTSGGANGNKFAL